MNPINPILAKAINYLTKNELWARELLKPHAGKIAQIKTELTQLEFSVDNDGFFSTENKSTIGNIDDKVVDVVLHIMPKAYLAWLQQGKQGFQKQIKISGDAEFASTLAKIFDQIRFEPEELLAPMIGDIPAYRLSKIGKSLTETTNNMGHHLFRSMADYLFDEEPQLAPKLLRSSLFDHFKTKVVELRDDVSRIEKRMQLLDQKLASKQKNINN